MRNSNSQSRKDAQARHLRERILADKLGVKDCPNTFLILHSDKVPASRSPSKNSSSILYNQKNQGKKNRQIYSVPQAKLTIPQSSAQTFIPLSANSPPPLKKSLSPATPKTPSKNSSAILYNKKRDNIASSTDSFDPNSLNILIPEYSGTKRAVLIGINYYNTKYQLSGCHQDVQDMAKVLTDTFNYDISNMTIMLDDEKDPLHKNPLSPTKANVTRVIKDLVAKTKPGDCLFIHYSGHGSRGYDAEGDEKDGMDDCICLVDDTEIIDDELHKILVDPFPTGARLRCLFDCCHSGSMLDLEFRWKYGHKTYMENNDSDEIQKDILMVSGCRDEQTSADAYISGVYSGACTWAVTDTIKEGTRASIDNLQKVTWMDFVSAIRFKLKTGEYEQVPQMCFTHTDQLDMCVDL